MMMKNRLGMLMILAVLLINLNLAGEGIRLSADASGAYVNGKPANVTEFLMDTEGHLEKTSSYELQLPEDVEMEEMLKYNRDYSSAMCWDNDRDRLFMKMTTADSIMITSTVSQRSTSDSYLACFDKEGKYLYRFAEEHNTKPGNLMDCWELDYDSGMLYGLDNNFRITCFDVSENAEFKSLVDVETLFNTGNIRVRNKKIIGGGIFKFPLMNDNTAVLLDIESDPEFPEAYEVSKSREIIDQKQYYEDCGFYNIMAEPLKFIGMDTQSDTLKCMMMMMISGGLFQRSQFEWYDDDTFYAVGCWGREVLKFNSAGDLLESDTLKVFSEYREYEIAQAKEKFKPGKGYDVFSAPARLLIDKNNNNLLIFYLFSSVEQERYGFESRMQLMVYSLDKREELCPLINVDFVPVAFDEGVIVGLQAGEDEILLNKYTLELK